MARLHGFATLVAVALTTIMGCSAGHEDVDPFPTEERDVVGKRRGSKQDAGGAPSDGEDSFQPPPRPVRWLANVGDSISQGYDADDADPIDLNALATAPDTVFRDQPALSWVRGDDPRVGSVSLHYRRLEPALQSTALSQSGAEVVGREDGIPNFEDQARAIATRGAKPDLVHVLLGGNDVCNRPPSSSGDATGDMYSVERWRGGVVAGLSVLAESLPDGAIVRVSSMPRVDLLYDVAGNATVPVKALVDSPAGPVKVDSSRTCKQLWSLASLARPNGICSIVTTERSDARRTQIGKRIDEYNVALAAEVRRFHDDPKLNPRRIVFQTDWAGSLASGAAKGSSVGTFVFEAAHVSKRDCFHPSIAGQRKLAELVLTRAKWTP